MSSKLSSMSRAAVALSSVAMIAVLFLPIWRIELSAPQYPEGLALQIYANRIGGDVDVVNGLNHYIGMHTLHSNDFVEFVALPYIIGTFAALGFLVALINRNKVLYGWFFLFLLIAFASILDFYRWEYNYGHNLDPEAPIRVPGMAYQPPLLGYKQLLNFGAYSIPDSGGWIFVAVGVVLTMAVFREYRITRRRRAKMPKAAYSLLLLALPGLQSCRSGPEPIRYGADNCDFCKMTFTDRHYGGEIITPKGKVYKFDDLHCLLASLKAGVPEKDQIGSIYFVDFNGGALIRSGDAWLLRSDMFHTPMDGKVAAFADSISRSTFQSSPNSQAVSWNELYR